MKTNAEDAKKRIESKPTKGIDERQESNQENKNEPMSFFLSVWPRPIGKPGAAEEEAADIMRFLLRMRCQQLSQLSALHSTPPHSPGSIKHTGWRQGQARLCHIIGFVCTVWPKTPCS